MKYSLAISLALWLALSTGSAALAKADVTKLLLKSEVEAALGASVSEPDVVKNSPPLGGTQATYSTSSLPIKTFSLTLRSDADIAPTLKATGMTVANLYKQTKSQPTGKIETLAIKGGEGFYCGSSAHVLKNNVYLSTSTFFGRSAKAIAVLKDLTSKAADRL